MAAPFREAEFDILYGEGISREGDLIDLGVDKGILEKSGTWISFGGERMGQGRENARIFLKENKDIREKLEGALRKKLGIPSADSSASAGAGTTGAPTHGPNGHSAAPAQPEKLAQSEKSPVKAAAATASSSPSDAGKARPTR